METRFIIIEKPDCPEKMAGGDFVRMNLTDEQKSFLRQHCDKILQCEKDLALPADLITLYSFQKKHSGEP